MRSKEIRVDTFTLWTANLDEQEMKQQKAKTALAQSMNANV